MTVIHETQETPNDTTIKYSRYLGPNFTVHELVHYFQLLSGQNMSDVIDDHD